MCAESYCQLARPTERSSKIVFIQKPPASHCAILIGSRDLRSAGALKSGMRCGSSSVVRHSACKSLSPPAGERLSEGIRAIMLYRIARNRMDTIRSEPITNCVSVAERVNTREVETVLRQSVKPSVSQQVGSCGRCGIACGRRV